MNPNTEIQRHLNYIMQVFEYNDLVYKPKIVVSYLYRDDDKKHTLKYEYDCDIFRSAVTARKYDEIISTHEKY